MFEQGVTSFVVVAVVAVVARLRQGSDLYRNIIDVACMVCSAQVKFNGSTGPVAFDLDGHRRNYRLAVLEQKLDSDITVKVGQYYSGQYYSNPRMS